MAKPSNPENTEEKRICVGCIAGAHGIKGAVKLHSYTEIPENIANYKTLGSEDASRHFELTVISAAKNPIIVSISGVSDRNEAEKLRNTKLYIDRSELPELEDEDDFYLEDLIGLEAKLEDGALYGTVKYVVNYGAGDILEIQTNTNKKTELIPFTKEAVPELHITQGYLVLSPPELIYIEDGNVEIDEADEDDTK